MAAVWGDTFMAWTGNHGRKKTRRRHRPLLEHLDDRCLLSTGTAIKLADRLAGHAVVRRHAPIKHRHEDLTREWQAQTAHHSAKLRELERPAGAIETGAQTALVGTLLAQLILIPAAMLIVARG